MKKSMRFTLIELLVVIAIIAILASILMPALSSARKRAKSSTCTNNLKSMMLAYSQYGDSNGGVGPLQECTTAGLPRYSFLLRFGKYNTNWRTFFCPETDPIGYLGFAKKTASDYGTWSNYRGVKHYEVDNWQQIIAMDNYAYSVNYKCFQTADLTKEEWKRNEEAQIPVKAGSSSLYNTDYNCLNIGKVRKPGTFVVLADGADLSDPMYRYRHRPALYTTINTWGGVPFDVHRSQAMNTAYLDGHVALADEGELRRNFANKDIAFVSESATKGF